MNLAWQWKDDRTAAVSNAEPNTVSANSKDKTNHPSSGKCIQIMQNTYQLIYELSLVLLVRDV